MSREPFVWEVHVRREMLDDEVGRLRELPYAVWRDVVGIPQVKTVTGRDQKAYTVTVTAEFVGRGAADIRVTTTLAGPGLRRSPVQQAFVITPDNLFV